MSDRFQYSLPVYIYRTEYRVESRVKYRAELKIHNIAYRLLSRQPLICYFNRCLKPRYVQGVPKRHPGYPGAKNEALLQTPQTCVPYSLSDLRHVGGVANAFGGRPILDAAARLPTSVNLHPGMYTSRSLEITRLPS